MLTTCDLINYRFDADLQKLMWAVTGNKRYNNDALA